MKTINPIKPYIDNTNYNTYYNYFKLIFMFPVAIIRLSIVALDFATLILISKFVSKKYATNIYRIFSKVILMCCGIYKIDILNTGAWQPNTENLYKNYKEWTRRILNENAIIVYNHVSMLDTHVISAVVHPTAPIIYYKYYAYLKPFVDFCDGICVNDDIKGSSNTTKIIEHVNAKKRLLGIAPEGVITNGKYLVNFKTGAFITNSPIQPIVIKYPNRYINISWCLNYPTLFIVYNMLCQFYNNASIELLPLQYKKENETPREFADRVRKVMTDVSGLKLVDIDGREKYNSFKIYKQELQKNKIKI